METERERERERERESVKRRPASIEQDADWSNVTSSGRPAANENCERSVASNPTRLFSDSLFVCFFLRFFFVPSSNGIGMGSDWSGKRDTQKKKTNNNKKKHPVSELGGCGRGKIDFFFFTQTKKRKKETSAEHENPSAAALDVVGAETTRRRARPERERERERKRRWMGALGFCLFVCVCFLCVQIRRKRHRPHGAADGEHKKKREMEQKKEKKRRRRRRRRRCANVVKGKVKGDEKKTGPDGRYTKKGRGLHNGGGAEVTEQSEKKETQT